MNRQVAIVSLSILALVAAQLYGSTLPVYRDTSRPFEERAADLVSRMTLEEKASQLVNDAAAIPRLGIREYNWWNEGLHGVAAAGYATVFPQAIGMAATFDTAHIEEVATVIGTEFRAKHLAEQHRFGGSDWFAGLTVWSPNINIFRDPRWGRGQETYGEDPFLTSQWAWRSSRACKATIPLTSVPLRPRSTSLSTAAPNRAAIATTYGPHHVTSPKRTCPRSGQQ
jgi:beta-glucosidase